MREYICSSKLFISGRLLIAVIVSVGFFHAASGQSAVYKLHDLGAANEIYFNDSLWYFYGGPLPKEKLPSMDQWDTLRYTDFGEQNLPKRWHGVGWFGLWIKIDSSLVDRKLSLRINHDGASEIFIDGRPVGGYGKVGESHETMEAVCAPKDVILFSLADTKPHLITLHYSNFEAVYADFVGFKLSLGDYNIIAPRMAHYKQLYDLTPMCAAAQIILGLLHFFLFLFYRKQKLNLHYAILVVLIGINTAGIYLFYQTRSPHIQFFAEFIVAECKVLIIWSGVYLLHLLNYGKVPIWRQRILGIVSLLYFVFYVLKYIYFPTVPINPYFSIVFFIFSVDGAVSVIQIVRRGQKGAWLVGAGVVTVILLYFFAWDDTFQIWPYHLNAMRIFILAAGQLVLPICLALYLGIDFARTNQALALKLNEVEELSQRSLAQEAEKTALISGEAKRLEETIRERTQELVEKADKLREMDIVKSRFFTNITHEFRTPLTLIINPAKELLSGTNSDRSKQNSQLILSNATRLLHLINQLLDLSKLENNLMEVNKHPMDLVELIRMNVLSYGSLGKQKNIQLNFISDWDQLWIAGDRDKLDKVVLNLLSNAIKFTDRGSVEVFLRKDVGSPDDVFHLTVKDTGRGIPASKLPYIFSRFYQVDPSDTRAADGTGIGLSVSKELVELMGGEITVESVEGIFTAVTIQMRYSTAEPIAAQAIAVDENDARSTSGYNAPIVINDDKPLLLLVEDHEELRQFIHRSLERDYRVLNAANGQQGIELALEHIPNLIITDLMMPDVDGYHLTTTLKASEKTSHVPIIMLTAKTSADSRVRGISSGADAYLGKPFDQRELFALVENLIGMRKQLREKYSRSDLWFRDTVMMPTIEQAFIARVRKAVESHLDDEGYGTDQLAMEVGLSRTQLHRKLKAIIGQAPGELIRIVRLQHAHRLLQQRVATVSEVAYMVGFSSPASFSASFSRHFGFSPKTVNA